MVNPQEAAQHVQELIHDQKHFTARWLKTANERSNMEREHIAATTLFIVAAYLIAGQNAQFMCNMILVSAPLLLTYVYPAECPDKDHLLIYWGSFGSLTLLDLAFEHVVPAYYVLKLILLALLFLRPFRYVDEIAKFLKRIEDTAQKSQRTQQDKISDKEKKAASRRSPVQKNDSARTAISKTNESTRTALPKANDSARKALSKTDSTRTAIPKSAVEEVKEDSNNKSAASTNLLSVKQGSLKLELLEKYKKEEPRAPSERIVLNEWIEVFCFDPFPDFKLVQALFRPLDTLEDEHPEQFVALRYHQGEPVMGRIWRNADDKIEAEFSWGGHDYRNPNGPILVLCELPENVRAFDYDWKEFKEAAIFGEKEWHPVHVNQHKGDISPGVLIIDGKEILGKVDVRNERAAVGLRGKEILLAGPAVHKCQVLCRKAKPGCKFD